MIIFPWRTDAPIYHFPFATIVLIAINAFVFVQAIQSPAEGQQYSLHYGDGLHPVQWITGNFLHANLTHLVGNMVFLWSFGLIVEGKLGWWRFLILYLGIGVLESAFEQTLMLGREGGGSVGASAIVFGLLATALVWAPKNELSCFVWVGFRPFNWDVSLLYFGLMYIGLQVLLASLAGTQVSGALLHLFGAAFGLVAGIALLKLDWVDCEGWDLFNVLRDRQHEAQYEKRRSRRDSEEDDDVPVKIDPADSLKHLAAMAKAGHASNVPALYQRLRHETRQQPLPRVELTQLIAAMHEQQAWNDSIPLMVDLLKMYPEQSARVRLRLGQVLLLQVNRPNQALRVLRKLRAGELPENLDAARQQMLARAEKLRDEGELELQADDW